MIESVRGPTSGPTFLQLTGLQRDLAVQICDLCTNLCNGCTNLCNGFQNETLIIQNLGATARFRRPETGPCTNLCNGYQKREAKYSKILFLQCNFGRQNSDVQICAAGSKNVMENIQNRVSTLRFGFLLNLHTCEV